MPRVKEEPRGRLAALQDMLAGGSQVILDQAQTLRDEVQRRLGDVGRGLEGQLGTMMGGLEERLSTQLDDLVSGVAVSIRRDIESKKAEHDVKTAQRAAESAEDDAEFAIQYAYWAVEDAEYAVLDATLARMDADSLAGSRA